jgi:hypothetical protein
VDETPLGSSYTWSDALAVGLSRRQVDRDGRRLGHGLYLSCAAEPTLVELCRAWARVLPAAATFGGTTAAFLLGAPLSEPPRLTVVVPPGIVVPARRQLVRHVRTISDADVVEVAGIRVTSGAQTFLDLAARLSPADLVVAGDALSRLQHLDPTRLAERLERADGLRGVVRARACAPLLSSLAMSRPESLMRFWLVTSDLPDPEPQVAVVDRWGREVTHADLGYSDWKIALEYEGRQHTEPDQFRRDVDRYSLTALDGWLVLRFADHHLGGPRTVVERTRRALVSRGWRPTPR